MIRDPSDGSVKEKTKIDMTSGLSTSKVNAEELARLERSREWLKNRRENAVSYNSKISVRTCQPRNSQGQLHDPDNADEA